MERRGEERELEEGVRKEKKGVERKRGGVIERRRVGNSSSDFQKR
jgi:hypothetical protein